MKVNDQTLENMQLTAANNMLRNLSGHIVLHVSTPYVEQGHPAANRSFDKSENGSVGGTNGKMLNVGDRFSHVKEGSSDSQISFR